MSLYLVARRVRASAKLGGLRSLPSLVIACFNLVPALADQDSSSVFCVGWFSMAYFSLTVFSSIPRISSVLAVTDSESEAALGEGGGWVHSVSRWVVPPGLLFFAGGGVVLFMPASDSHPLLTG